MTKWDVGILNKLIGMTYKKNHYITKFNLRNIQRLLRESDFSLYQNKSIIIKRIEFLNRSLEAKLDKKFQDESIIINYAIQDSSDTVTNDIINNLPKYKQLNHAEITYMNEMVEDRLKYGQLINYTDELESIITKLRVGEYSTYAEAFNVMADWVNRFKESIRQIRSEMNKGMIRFNDSNIRERIDDILTKLGTTNSGMVTGVRMLNRMVGGMFCSGQLYIIAAVPANFKSGLLLKIAIDGIMYNSKTYLGRKEGHKKAVVYFTMENMAEHSFQRAYQMSVKNDDIRDMQSKKIEADMRRVGLIGNEDMELIIVYRPNRSISTVDLRAFIEELDEENIEVCLLCFDYIKRIRPFEKALTEKEELKNVTNELRQIAIDFDIPVISAAQLNRQAASIINSTVRAGKADALKEIDSSLIGSAWEIMENADMVIMIAMQERVKDKTWWLSFLFCKGRYYHPDFSYFNQPFDKDKFNLQDDIMLQQDLGVMSLATDFKDIDLDEYTERGRKHHMVNGIVPIEEDIFDVMPL